MDNAVAVCCPAEGMVYMTSPKEMYYDKRAVQLVKNLKSRHFEAYYCANAAQALQTALSLIPEGASVGWGGAMSAQQIGLMTALRQGNYAVIDREQCTTPEEIERVYMDCLHADYFLTGANALSIDGEMVNIDGTGNRLAAITYGPKNVIVIAGMNKVMDTLEDAVSRARSVAAPLNIQRFDKNTPCSVTGVCADCKSKECICNQILITRNCRPEGRIKFILVGQDLGL